MANTHLVFILLVIFSVFTYRDGWPLATFHKHPADAAEGHLLWVKYIVLTMVAIFVPLVIPRVYIPLDPKVYTIISISVIIN